MILFVDDDAYYVHSYLEELRDSGFAPLYEAKVSGAMRLLEDRSFAVSLIVTDIMMASGGVFRDDTMFDLRTGFAFYDWIRQRAPQLPIIVLTNVPSDDVDNKFAADANCKVLRKFQCMPFQLVEHVREMLKPQSSDR